MTLVNTLILLFVLQLFSQVSEGCTKDLFKRKKGPNPNPAQNNKLNEFGKPQTSYSLLKAQNGISDVQYTDCVYGVSKIEGRLRQYIYLRKLQNTDENQFYKCLIENVDLMLPVVYTPAVGDACQNYKLVLDLTDDSDGTKRGITLNLFELKTKDKIKDRLRKWPKKDIKAIVVTDGERILGLGDLGANGMGIPVGKMTIYSALGGIHPDYCLPVTLDVGTNNKDFLNDKKELYVGQLLPRMAPNNDVIDYFMQAATEVYGKRTLIQFEDFNGKRAGELLKRYQDKYTTFNDDIQGTAAVAVAGIMAAARFTNQNIKGFKILFVGAGAAATGIAELLVLAMGGEPEQNRRKIYMKEREGLLSTNICAELKANNKLSDDDPKRLYCHNLGVNDKDENTKGDLDKIIKFLKPNVLIGVSGQPRLFTYKALREMANYNDHPIIFPLSNPTEKSECTAAHAYEYTNGKCLFASGSPFDPVTLEVEVEEGGKKIKKTITKKPQQCNNSNIFPGVALGIITAKMKTVPNEVFLIAAKTLAEKCTTQEDFDVGSLFPKLTTLRECSVKIATEIVTYAHDNGLADTPRPKDIKSHIESNLYTPR